MLNLTPYGHASEADLTALETSLHVQLPADYRAFLSSYNGGRVENQVFFVQDLQQDILLQVLFGVNNPSRTLNVAFWVKEFEEDLQAEALVVGKEPGGGLLLYLTAGEDKGVYFWDHAHFFPQSTEEEGNTYFLAGSFAEFCDSLVDFTPA